MKLVFHLKCNGKHIDNNGWNKSVDHVSTRLNCKIYNCPLLHTKSGLLSEEVSIWFYKRNKEKPNLLSMYPKYSQIFKSNIKSNFIVIDTF